MTDQQKLSKLNNEISLCAKCALYRTRNKAVTGKYSENSEIVFITSSPTQSDNKCGVPLKEGRNSKYFKFCLKKARIDYNRINVISCVKCITPHKNRKDRSLLINESTSSCLDYLQKQLEILNPKLVITLGKFPLSIFLSNLLLNNKKIPQEFVAHKFRNKIANLTELHGRFLMLDTFWRNSVILFPTWYTGLIVSPQKKHKETLLKDLKILRNLKTKALKLDATDYFFNKEKSLDLGISRNVFDITKLLK